MIAMGVSCRAFPGFIVVIATSETVFKPELKTIGFLLADRLEENSGLASLSSREYWLESGSVSFIRRCSAWSSDWFSPFDIISI